jgi:hypothetical protein
MSLDLQVLAKVEGGLAELTLNRWGASAGDMSSRPNAHTGQLVVYDSAHQIMYTKATQ